MSITTLAPSNLSDTMFTLSHQIHNHNIRSSAASNYYVNCSWLNQHKNSFSKIGNKIWTTCIVYLWKIKKSSRSRAYFQEKDSNFTNFLLVSQFTLLLFHCTLWFPLIQSFVDFQCLKFFISTISFSFSYFLLFVKSQLQENKKIEFFNLIVQKQQYKQ